MTNAHWAMMVLRRGHQLGSLAIVCSLILVSSFIQTASGQTKPPLNLFKNYFVTGDYVVAGWVEGAPDGSGYAPGKITIPDTRQPMQIGVPASVPNGADIVAVYLYWATVEGNQSSFVGQHAFFNGYPVDGVVLGNPNAPVSWSSGGCSGAAQGSKTMRTYRADVRQYMPIDTNPASATFGTIIVNGSVNVSLADSGSNGNGTPNALGATLVVIYRVLSPAAPLNAIVLYDGAFAPSNTSQTTTQTLVGFYEPAASPISKLTHIVSNGQQNKGEQVYLNNQLQPLPSLYGTLPPFPGVYGAWDNPTWLLSQYGYVGSADTAETTTIVPNPNNSGCVSWGAMIMSTTVQDTDHDGLLDVWELNQGYTDAVSNQWVALPGANPSVKDIFAEVDYLTNLDGSGGAYLHSHLPKQDALDAVGNAFLKQGVSVHFDLGVNSAGQNIYPNDSFVISYPLPIPNPLPAGTLPPQAGAGGNPITEGALVCVDGATKCAYPNQPAVGWKGDFQFVRDNAIVPNSNPPLALGNFQPGRPQSYHYLLFGHSLGAPRSYWTTYGFALADPMYPKLVSIQNAGGGATITITSPPGMLHPGDCSVVPPLTPPAACSDASNGRVTIAGALGQPNLNGTYIFANANSTTDKNGVTTTNFTIPTNGVAAGNYTFSNEPQLAVAYLGPTSTSGHSDFGGGGDSAITLGLWGADDSAGCQADPSQSLAPGQDFCNNQVGSTAVQTGTILHELGHSLTLTHGGTYYLDPANPSVPSYELNCKPNFMSAMNYLFQVRGFVDGGYDLSEQTMPPLNEVYSSLNELAGLGLDLDATKPAAHLTRWYSSPNAVDIQLQNTTGGRYATAHCDGSPLLQNEPAAVRVDGAVALGGTYSGPLDWNNNFLVPDAVLSPGEDLNHNGVLGDLPFSGFDDWQVVAPTPTSGIALQQINARGSAFGSSSGAQARGGGAQARGGGIDVEGGGAQARGGGSQARGGGAQARGGGTDQDEDTAASTVNEPASLLCSNCGVVSGVLTENGRIVQLAWTPPSFGQIRKYYVWRATGSFPTLQQVRANLSKFSNIKTLTGAPPSTSHPDNFNLKNNTSYTYFVTDANLQGAQSGPSKPLVVYVKF